MDDALEKFGSAVKTRREELGLTQVELGEKLGISYRIIMKVENFQSNCKFETIALLAQGLNISLDAVILSTALNADQIPKIAADFFTGMSPEKASRYVAILEEIKSLTES